MSLAWSLKIFSFWWFSSKILIIYICLVKFYDKAVHEYFYKYFIKRNIY